MLTGKMAFPGDTISDTLAAVLKPEPDWDALPETRPSGAPPADALPGKRFRKRLRDIGEARIRIDRSLSGETVELPSDPMAAPGEIATAPEAVEVALARRRWRATAGAGRLAASPGSSKTTNRGE